MPGAGSGRPAQRVECVEVFDQAAQHLDRERRQLRGRPDDDAVARRGQRLGQCREIVRRRDTAPLDQRAQHAELLGHVFARGEAQHAPRTLLFVQRRRPIKRERRQHLGRQVADNEKNIGERACLRGRRDDPAGDAHGGEVAQRRFGLRMVEHGAEPAGQRRGGDGAGGVGAQPGDQRRGGAAQQRGGSGDALRQRHLPPADRRLRVRQLEHAATISGQSSYLM